MSVSFFFCCCLQFRRATVQNSLTGELQTAQYRISKSAWLKEEEHIHVANVCKRVSDMTNLTMETAEELQVVNYGIGGHYEPHFDFARVSLLYFFLLIFTYFYLIYRKMRKMRLNH